MVEAIQVRGVLEANAFYFPHLELLAYNSCNKVSSFLSTVEFTHLDICRRAEGVFVLAIGLHS